MSKAEFSALSEEEGSSCFFLSPNDQFNFATAELMEASSNEEKDKNGERQQRERRQE